MISVIIPAHNAADTIERAIQSALKNVPDPEIIVVENGSADDTQQVVRSMQEAYPEVKLICSGTGVSRARNAGISAAQGEWLLFLDADDYLEDGSRPVLERCSSDAGMDLWLFGHRAGAEARGVTDTDQAEIFDVNRVTEARVRMIEDPTRYMQVWGKLFRRSVIAENAIVFDENLSLSEDSDFTLRYTRYGTSICFLPNILYHYSLDQTSAMRQYDGTKAERYVLAMRRTGESVADETGPIQEAFRKYVLMHMNIAMVREVFAVGISGSKSSQIEQMRRLADTDVFADAIRNTVVSNCLSARMLPTLFLKFRMYGLAACIYRIRAGQNAKQEGRNNSNIKKDE